MKKFLDLFKPKPKQTSFMAPHQLESIERAFRANPSNIGDEDIDWLIQEAKRSIVFREAYFNLIDKELERIQRIVDFESGC